MAADERRFNLIRTILAVAIATVAGFPSFVFASEQKPTVKEFLAACSNVRHIPRQKDSDAEIDCLDRMMIPEMASGYCPPPDPATQPDDVRLAAINWLKDRPDMFNMDEAAGILVALKAMYCH